MAFTSVRAGGFSGGRSFSSSRPAITQRNVTVNKSTTIVQHGGGYDSSHGFFMGMLMGHALSQPAMVTQPVVVGGGSVVGSVGQGQMPVVY